MAITGIWTAHCDVCAYWDESVMGDTKAEVRAAAKEHGWRVGPFVVLCPDCEKADQASRADASAVTE